MTLQPNDSEPLLTPAEVAAMFRVDPKTVTRWAKSGKLSSVRTLGGHRRYLASEVRAWLDGVPGQRVETDNRQVAAERPATAEQEATAAKAPERTSGLDQLPPPPATPGSSGGLPSSH